MPRQGDGELVAGTELAVSFCGQRGGCGELTWSQRSMWNLHEHLWPDHSYYNMQQLLRLPDGLTLPDAARLLRLLLEHHESLRTTVYRLDDGWPQQRVARRGEFALRVHEAGDTPGSHLAERLSAEYLGHPFRDDEWPLRVAVVTERGSPRFLVLVVSHLAVDWWGLRILTAGFSRLLADGEDAVPPRYQPLDHAASEASEASRRGARRAVDYWRRTLMDVPQTMFPVRTSPDDRVPWCPRAVLASRALPMAAAVLSERYGVSPSVVILAAAATLLGIRTGNERAVLRLFAPNRYSAQAREMVGTLFQSALFAVDLDAQTFGQMITRSAASVMAAYRYSRYPPEDIDRVIAEVEAARGIHLELECYARTVWETAPGSPAAGPASAEQIAAALSSSRLEITASWGRRHDFQFDVDLAADGSMHAVITADPRFLSRGDLPRLLRGVETLVVRSVTDEVDLSQIGELTGIVPKPRGVSTRLVDRCWVEPGAVAYLLRTVPGVTTARVSIGQEAGGRAEIVAEVTTDRDDLTEQALRSACLAAVPGMRTAVVPHRYEIHRAVGQPT